MEHKLETCTGRRPSLFLSIPPSLPPSIPHHSVYLRFVRFTPEILVCLHFSHTANHLPATLLLLLPPFSPLFCYFFPTLAFPSLGFHPLLSSSFTSIHLPLLPQHSLLLSLDSSPLLLTMTPFPPPLQQQARPSPSTSTLKKLIRKELRPLPRRPEQLEGEPYYYVTHHTHCVPDSTSSMPNPRLGRTGPEGIRPGRPSCCRKGSALR